MICNPCFHFTHSSPPEASHNICYLCGLKKTAEYLFYPLKEMPINHEQHPIYHAHAHHPPCHLGDCTERNIILEQQI